MVTTVVDPLLELRCYTADVEGFEKVAAVQGQCVVESVGADGGLHLDRVAPDGGAVDAHLVVATNDDDAAT